MKEFTGIEDAPHPFDAIDCWPKPSYVSADTHCLPNGWHWARFNDEWVMSNGTIGLTSRDWENYCNKKDAAQPFIPATREEVMALIDTWPVHLENNGKKITGNWVWASIQDIPVIVEHTMGKTITESDWREHLVGVLRDNQPLGTKADDGKVMMGAMPPHAELAVARVLTFGAKKYGRGNWARVENSDEHYMDAALRHINAYRRGEQTDSETGESHLAHAICCLIFMLDKSEMSDL